MNPAAVAWFAQLVPPVPALPAGPAPMCVLYDLASEVDDLRRLSDLQQRLSTLAPPAARLTLAVDLRAAMPLHVAPPRTADTLSALGQHLRQRLLQRGQLAAPEELDELDVASACSCPLLQWQWLVHAAAALVPPAGVESIAFADGPPRSTRLTQAAYTQTCKDIYEQWLVRSNSFRRHLDAGQTLSPALAHFVFAQQLIHAGTGDTDWHALRMTRAKFQGEAILRLTQQLLADAPGRITLLMSKRPDALLIALCTLATRAPSEVRPGHMFLGGNGASGFVDIGALYNAIRARAGGSAAHVASLLIAAALPALRGPPALFDEFARAAWTPFPHDDLRAPPDEMAARRWCIAAYGNLLQAGTWDAEPVRCDPAELFREAQRRRLTLPHFAGVPALVADAYDTYFVRLQPRANKDTLDHMLNARAGQLRVVAGRELETLGLRYCFDLRHPPLITCWSLS